MKRDKVKRDYLPDSELTYGPKWPNHRTVDGNKYRWCENQQTWLFVCGPEW